MANTHVLTQVAQTGLVQDVYDYPADCQVIPFQSSAGAWHIIVYAGAPSTDFGNAPNGSILIDTTDKRLYMKNGTFGAIDGTWSYGAIAT